MRTSEVGEPVTPFAAKIFKRTTVPLGPRISLTASSVNQPITSTKAPPSPCATPTIRSLGLINLLRNAGPPGIKS